MPALTVAEIAARLGGEFEGDGTCVISGVGGVRDARAGDLTFISNPRYAAEVASTCASAVLVARSWTRACPASLIRVGDPDQAFAQAVAWFAPAPVQPASGIHPTAVIAPDARVGEGASIGPYCVVEPGASIGARTVLFAGCYVGHGASVGEDGRLYPHVSIRERCRIGHRAILHNGVVVGSDGFGYSVDANGVRTKIPQVGIVVIGDDVEIGANSTIDRARFGKTLIGNGVKIDNLVQIAHNVVIGDHSVLVAQVGIAGSVTLGARVIVAGQAGIVGHLVVGDGAIIGGQSGVHKNVQPGQYMFGYPAVEQSRAMKIHAHLQRLPEMRDRLLALEARLARLEARP